MKINSRVALLLMLVTSVGFASCGNSKDGTSHNTPSAPAAPTVTVGDGQLALSWDAVSGATAYEVWYSTNEDSASAVQQGGDITTISYTIEYLTNGTYYYVWLKAKNSAGTSDVSPPANGTPQSPKGEAPVFIRSFELINSRELTGIGNIIGTTYTDETTGAYAETLKIYQQDSTDADLLIELCSVYLGIDTLYHGVADIELNSQWATIAMNASLSTGNGWVALVPLSGPSYSLSALITLGDNNISKAVAMGEWLLVTSKATLTVYSITTPSSPVQKGTYTLSSIPTSITGLPNGFFITTANGYAFLDVSNSSNITLSEETANDNAANIRQADKAYLIDNKLYIGGPSKYTGMYKIARLDMTTPSSPTIDIIEDKISWTDSNYYDGELSNFGYDGANAEYYVQNNDIVRIYKEDNGVLTLTMSLAFPSYEFVNPPSNYGSFYVWNGRFYTEGSGSSYGGISIYRTP